MNGNLYQTCTSAPWGEVWGCYTPSGGYSPEVSRVAFAGMEHDAESAQMHTWFRNYNTRVERWMTPDPAGLAVANPANPQSWNRYAYVGNSPTNFIDPLGLLKPGPCLLGDPICTPPTGPIGGLGGGGGPTGCVEGTQLVQLSGTNGGPIVSGANGCGNIGGPGGGNPKPKVKPPNPANEPKVPPPSPSSISALISSEYEAYKQCTGPAVFSSIDMPSVPHFPVPRPGFRDDFGHGADVPLDVGPTKTDLALSTAAQCLRMHPLAALDPRFNDIEPGSAF